MTLPQETIDKIEKDAEHYANVQWTDKGKHIGHSQSDKWDQSKEDYEAGATEYVNKLHQANQEIAQLKRWKMEATELLTPILEYGQSKEAGIPLGESITVVVLERCKQAHTARTLLEKFISRHEAGLLPDRFIYEQIKTFLDGTKRAT